MGNTTDKAQVTCLDCMAAELELSPTNCVICGEPRNKLKKGVTCGRRVCVSEEYGD